MFTFLYFGARLGFAVIFPLGQSRSTTRSFICMTSTFSIAKAIYNYALRIRSKILSLAN